MRGPAEASTLSALLEETRGVVGVVLATTSGELHAVLGTASDVEATAATAAVLARELNAIGTHLGIGALGVASIKSPTASRVIAQQRAAVLAIELDPKCAIAELETKLRTLAWAPADAVMLRPAVKPPAAEPPRAPRPPTAAPPLPTSRPSMLAAGSLPPVLARGARPPVKVVVPPLPAPAGSTPVFSGDLDAFCLPDLLEFLRNSQRTGLLQCATRSASGSIRLFRGMIVSADSPNALDLQTHFSAHPQLAPETRREIASLPPEAFGDGLLQSPLVTSNHLPFEEVERARSARIYSAIREMIKWIEGRFSFDPTVAITSSPELGLSSQTILMHIYQEQDEQGR